VNRADDPMVLVYNDDAPACSVCQYYSVNIGIAGRRSDLLGPLDECETCPSKDLRLRYGA